MSESKVKDLTLDFHPQEDEALSWPARWDMWQRNWVMGIELCDPEKGMRSEGGIHLLSRPGLRPWVMKVIKISRYVSAPGEPDFVPVLWELQQAFDPDKTGFAITNGPHAVYNANAAWGIDFPLGENEKTYVMINGEHVLASYIPKTGCINPAEVDIAELLGKFNRASLAIMADAPSSKLEIPTLIKVK